MSPSVALVLLLAGVASANLNKFFPYENPAYPLSRNYDNQDLLRLMAYQKPIFFATRAANNEDLTATLIDGGISSLAVRPQYRSFRDNLLTGDKMVFMVNHGVPNLPVRQLVVPQHYSTLKTADLTHNLRSHPWIVLLDQSDMNSALYSRLVDQHALDVTDDSVKLLKSAMVGYPSQFNQFYDQVPTNVVPLNRDLSFLSNLQTVKHGIEVPSTIQPQKQAVAIPYNFETLKHDFAAPSTLNSFKRNFIIPASFEHPQRVFAIPSTYPSSFNRAFAIPSTHPSSLNRAFVIPSNHPSSFNRAFAIPSTYPSYLNRAFAIPSTYPSSFGRAFPIPLVSQGLQPNFFFNPASSNQRVLVDAGDFGSSADFNAAPYYIFLNDAAGTSNVHLVSDADLLMKQSMLANGIKTSQSAANFASHLGKSLLDSSAENNIMSSASKTASNAIDQSSTMSLANQQSKGTSDLLSTHGNFHGSSGHLATGALTESLDNSAEKSFGSSSMMSNQLSGTSSLHNQGSLNRGVISTGLLSTGAKASSAAETQSKAVQHSSSKSSMSSNSNSELSQGSTAQQGVIGSLLKTDADLLVSAGASGIDSAASSTKSSSSSHMSSSSMSSEQSEGSTQQKAVIGSIVEGGAASGHLGGGLIGGLLGGAVQTGAGLINTGSRVVGTAADHIIATPVDAISPISIAFR